MDRISASITHPWTSELTEETAQGKQYQSFLSIHAASTNTQTDTHIRTHCLVPTSSRFQWTWWVGAERHVWTETHSLLFPLQQTVLQMSSIIPPSLPSHSSTLSHAIMAIALSGVLFPLLVKFFPMIGEFPIMGHKAKNARHVFFPNLLCSLAQVM